MASYFNLSFLNAFETSFFSSSPVSCNNMKMRQKQEHIPKREWSYWARAAYSSPRVPKPLPGHTYASWYSCSYCSESHCLPSICKMVIDVMGRDVQSRSGPEGDLALSFLLKYIIQNYNSVIFNLLIFIQNKLNHGSGQ
jgi:hypothetical protein